MRLAVLLGTANPMPTLPPAPMMAVLMPITFPSESKRGPPEFPGLIAASVWITPSIFLPFRASMVLPRALMIPVVRVSLRPKGFPRASTFCPTTISLESAKLSTLYWLLGASILRTARSLLGSVPISFPGHWLLSARVTMSLLAFSTTW